jgi:hypothetical protein
LKQDPAEERTDKQSPVQDAEFSEYALIMPRSPKKGAFRPFYMDAMDGVDVMDTKNAH